MKNLRNISAGDLARELVSLAALSRPSSGKLRKLETALLLFRGYGEILDENLLRFSEGVTKFVYAVERGHAGRTEWNGITLAAGKIAPVLDVLERMQKDAKV